MTPQTAVRSPASVVDYDIHGLVGIRLLDPSPADVATIAAQVGPPQGPLSRDPDITIRFVEEVRVGGTLSWIEPHEIGFTDEAFFLFTRASGPKPAACWALETADRSCETVCRSGLATVTPLRSLVDLSMLAKGVLALHASAFTYEGVGVLVAGWARAGKTTSLLAFAEQGAAFIGDDRVYVSPDGNRLYGLAEPVALRAWHLAELPRYREVVGSRARTRLRGWSVLGRAATWASARERIGGANRFAGRLASFADDASVAISPHRLFSRCPLSGRLDKTFLAIAHESDDVRVEPVEAEHLAERLVFSLRAERLRLLARYFALRFAFPGNPGALIERVDEIEREILLDVLAKSETYLLYHPFPAPVNALHEAMAPLVA